MGTQITEHETVNLSYSTVQQLMEGQMRESGPWEVEGLQYGFLARAGQLGLEPMYLDS